MGCWVSYFFVFLGVALNVCYGGVFVDKDLIVVEYLKIYFTSHPEKVPEDTDKAFEFFQKLHKKYKYKFLADYKQKSEKFVDKFFDDKDKKYY